MSVNEYTKPVVSLNRAISRKKVFVKPVVKTDPYKLIKFGIWTYFILLIFEGGLRKWVLPQLAAPLLVVRDPVVILILISAWNKGLITLNKYLWKI